MQVIVSVPCVLINPSSHITEIELPSWKLSPKRRALIGTPGSGHSLCPNAFQKKKKKMGRGNSVINLASKMTFLGFYSASKNKLFILGNSKKQMLHQQQKMYTRTKNGLQYDKVISARILVWTARRWLISVMAKFSFPIAHPIQCYNGPEASIRKASIYYVTISVIFFVFTWPSQPFEPYWPLCAWYCHSLFCFLYWEPVNKRDDVSERKKHWNFNHIIIFKVKEILSMYKSFQSFNFI